MKNTNKIIVVLIAIFMLMVGIKWAFELNIKWRKAGIDCLIDTKKAEYSTMICEDLWGIKPPSARVFLKRHANDNK